MHIKNNILADYLEEYIKNNQPVCVNFRKILPGLANSDRATHMIHPYPAKLLLNIPYLFLSDDNYSKPGDLVLDPFSGSGTVLLEAALAGRIPIGADANPFARLLTKVKTTPINIRILKNEIDLFFKNVKIVPEGILPDVVNIDYWFYPKVIKQLQCINEAIEKVEHEDVKDFLKVCFSNCVRKVSLADPHISVPVKLSIGKHNNNSVLGEQTNTLLSELKEINVLDVYKKVIEKNCNRLKSIEYLLGNKGQAKIISDDARKIIGGCIGRGEHTQYSNVKKGSVQLIVTSPPYPGAQKYIRSCTFSLGWLNMCASSDMMSIKRTIIGREEVRKVEYSNITLTGDVEADKILKKIFNKNPKRAAIAGNYLNEMKEVLKEMFSVLKLGGTLVIVVANNNIAGLKFKTVDYLESIAKKIGFEVILKLIDDIHSRGLMTKRNKTANIITREWVLVFKKRA